MPSPTMFPSQRAFTFVESRELDNYAQTNWGFSSQTLMGLAAKSFWDGYRCHFTERESALILCGKGNNGGDGYALAYFLATEGFRPTLIDWGGAQTPNARFYRDLACRLGIPCHPWQDLARVLSSQNGATVVVDCLLGTGSSKSSLPPDLESGLQLLVDWKSQRCSSGSDWFLALDSATGGLFPLDELGEIGNFKWENRHYPRSQKTSIPIGFPVDDFCQQMGKDRQIRHFFEPLPRRSLGTIFHKGPSDHKYRAGSALFLGGDCGMEGALALALSSFLGLGGGIAQAIFLSPEAKALYCPHHPSWMVETWSDPSPPDPNEGFWAKAQALVVGPGTHRNSLDRLARDTIRTWSSTLFGPKPNHRWVVWDAGSIPWGKDWDSPPSPGMENWILTPHQGELLHLAKSLGYPTEPDADSQGFPPSWDHLTETLAQRLGVWILAKSHHCLLAGPQGESWYWDFPNPKLATMGTGDLLTGILAIACIRLGSVPHAVQASLSLLHLTEKMDIQSPTAQEILDFLKVV